MRVEKYVVRSVYLLVLLVLLVVGVEPARTAPVVEPAAPMDETPPTWCPEGLNADGTCGSPYEITCNTKVSGDTTDQPNNFYTYDCDIPGTYRYLGPEDVYVLTLPASETRTFTVLAEVGVYEVDMDIFLIAPGGCESGTCVNPDSWGNKEAYAEDIDPGTYYLIVDGFGESGEGGKYDITLTCQTQNEAPDEPANPFPAHQSTGASLNPALSWTGSDPDGDLLKYTVSGKAAGEAVYTEWCTDVTQPTCSTGPLDTVTQYMWQVTAKDDWGGVTDGPVWEFTTGLGNLPPFKPYGPSPADEAADVPQGASLSWIGGDPDAIDTVTYDLYFGTNDPPPLLASDLTSEAYAPTMASLTKYYWKIVSKDNHGLSTEGDVWEFTTSKYKLYLPLISR
jgi:hypothetical protein